MASLHRLVAPRLQCSQKEEPVSTLPCVSLAGMVFLFSVLVLNAPQVATRIREGDTVRCAHHASPTAALEEDDLLTSEANGLSSAVDDPDERADLYGNVVTEAVAQYRLDAHGSLYELHSPQTELPRPGPPKT